MDTISNLNLENESDSSRHSRNQDEDEVFENIKTIVKGFLMKLGTSSLGMFTCFCLLQINHFFKFDFSIIFIPFILLEAGLVLIQGFKIAYIGYERLALIQLLVWLIDFAFWILLIVFIKSRSFSEFSLAVPVVLSVFLLIFKTFKSKNLVCKRLIYNEIFLRLCLVLILISTGLKQVRIIDWSWKSTMWPMWLIISYFFIGSAVSVGRLITATVKFIYIHPCKEELASSIWFFYLTSGGAGFGIAFMLSSKNTWVCFVSLQVYLFPLVLYTILMHSQLLLWISKELHSPDPSRLIQRHPIPSPSRNPSEIRSLLNFFPPMSLERITSTYFKPCSRQNKGRTMSEANLDDLGTGHFRSCTSPNVLELHNAEIEPDSSFANKKCSVCFENECNAVFLPCGHGGICILCSGKLVGNKKKCIICRAKIMKVLKIEVGKEKVLRVVGVK